MELFSAFLHNTLSFIAIISVIVFVHEFGHYAVAKMSGVKIDVFSLGFGKELWGWNDKSGTRWKVSLLPLGGYVKMFGDANATSMPDSKKIADFTEEEKKIAFQTKPLILKAIIVSAGPLANFLLAVVILSFFFCIYGKAYAPPLVEAVIKGSVADQAGILPGDEIESIDGSMTHSFSDIQRVVSTHPEQVLHFVIKRNQKELIKAMAPRLAESKDLFGNPIKIGMLGVSHSKMEYQKYAPREAIVMATKEVYEVSATTLTALGQIITGKRGTDDLGGSLRIAKYSGQSTSQGLKAVFAFMALLSINLGLINLFPIPLLDGGHLLYYAIEAATGRPLADRYQQYGFRFGLAVIISLFVLSTFNDLSKMFN